MDRLALAPEGVDMQQASPAWMYDALLGGSHNFEIDRKAAQSERDLDETPGRSLGLAGVGRKV